MREIHADPGRRRAPTSSSCRRTILRRASRGSPTDGIALGSLGLAREGWFDGYALMRAFRRKAESLGVEYLAAEVVGHRGGRWPGRRRRARRWRRPCRAARSSTPPGRGPPRSPRWPGSRCRSRPAAGCVFVFEAAEPPPDCPLVIDTSGAWFRPEGGAFIGSIPPPTADDLADLPLEVDRRMWDDALWPALAARVPAFDAVADDERLGRLLRVQHLRPQRDPRAAPRDREPAVRQRVLRPRHPAGARRSVARSPS